MIDNSETLLDGTDLVFIVQWGGGIDARFAGDTFNQLTESAENDPFNAAVGSAYTAAVNHYTRDVLKLGDDRPYRSTNARVDAGTGWGRVAAASSRARRTRRVIWYRR